MDYISPIGVLRIEASDRGLSSIRFLSQEQAVADPIPDSEHSDCIALCISALNSYFAKQWGAFNQFRSKIPLDLIGTNFQKRVWEVIYSLPNTYPLVSISYSELAYLSGNSKSVRACANACGKNSIPIIIPCHRIIAADNTLGGYSSGLSRKSWLLWHEGIPVKETKSSALLQQPPQAR